MRRDSWRSVPRICRPPASMTASWRACQSAVRRSRVASSSVCPGMPTPPPGCRRARYRAAARHIGGNGDHTWASGLGDDFRLLLVVLGVQYFVINLLLFKRLGELFGGLDRRVPTNTGAPVSIQARTSSMMASNFSSGSDTPDHSGHPGAWAHWSGSPHSPDRRSVGIQRPRCRRSRSCRPACRKCERSSGRW